MQKQYGELLCYLEWNNGTSFIYTLNSNKKCRTLKFDVGILTPNWLDGANYLGQEKVDGFLCSVWEKVDFIWYNEDVVTKRPVHGVFYAGMEAHLMTFEVGAVLEDEKWQAPVYCSESGEQADDSPNSAVGNSDSEDLFKRKMLNQIGFDGANYVGQQKIDGFLCNVWEKADFITYYEDVVTKIPVHFYTGRSAHVMTFEVGAALEDEHWQAPSYCFEGTEKKITIQMGLLRAPWRVF
ncbi:hypothetical protein MKX01_041071 [Papaver californicum]|nr:hypothetical protein MKX01_041071 [Papaver californicum]